MIAIVAHIAVVLIFAAILHAYLSGDLTMPDPSPAAIPPVCPAADLPYQPPGDDPATVVIVTEDDGELDLSVGGMDGDSEIDRPVVAEAVVDLSGDGADDDDGLD